MTIAPADKIHASAAIAAAVVEHHLPVSRGSDTRTCACGHTTSATGFWRHRLTALSAHSVVAVPVTLVDTALTIAVDALETITGLERKDWLSDDAPPRPHAALRGYLSVVRNCFPHKDYPDLIAHNLPDAILSALNAHARVGMALDGNEVHHECACDQVLGDEDFERHRHGVIRDAGVALGTMRDLGTVSRVLRRSATDLPDWGTPNARMAFIAAADALAMEISRASHPAGR